MNTEATRSIIVDADTRRPLCVLLQAAMGGDSSAVSALIPNELWQLHPPKPGRAYLVPGTPTQWREWSARQLKPTPAPTDGERTSTVTD
jgi:hypothetical protein